MVDFIFKLLFWARYRVGILWVQILIDGVIDVVKEKRLEEKIKKHTDFNNRLRAELRRRKRPTKPSS